MDDSLRNSLWNVIYLYYENEKSSSWERVAKSVARHVCKVTVDTIGGNSPGWLRNVFFEGPWHQAYDIIEHLYQYEVSCFVELSATPFSRIIDIPRDRFKALKSDLNIVLERELSGYRFISDKLTPITSAVEIAAIERAVNDLDV